jgi:16S rRNA (guanine966-N2)-methyltransferase
MRRAPLTAWRRAAPRGPPDRRHSRRSKLPVADRPGLRPTPDRVRETLFNWLGQDLTGWRVLDAFAGSGALGFEAASRGAAEVLLLERDPLLVRSAASQPASGCRPGAAVCSVATRLAWMAAPAPARFDLVLLDPPFDAGLQGALAGPAVPLLAPAGWSTWSRAALAPADRRRPGACTAGRAGAVRSCSRAPQHPTRDPPPRTPHGPRQ